MNFAYIVCSDNFFLHLENMLRSLDKHCNCTILANTFNVNNRLFEKLTSNFSTPIIRHDIPESEWVNRRMFSKIDRLLKMPFNYGDNVFVLDTDLIVQDDIYKAFEKDFDVCYTTRHYNYYFPINAGVWGFKYNKRSKRFLEFYVDQMLRPDWPPYVSFSERFKHTGLDWWCDQDFLCAVYENEGKLPFECKILDLGPKYNFCPGTDINPFEVAKKQLMDRLGNKEYKILHFKAAPLKKVMMELEI